MENGSDVLIFAHSHQEPSSAVLDVLELLKALARNPDEKCVAVIQPGGDKGVDQLFSIGQSEGGAEFGYVSEMEKGCFAEVFDMGLVVEVGVHFNTKIGDNG